jgi:hypothetical protein
MFHDDKMGNLDTNLGVILNYLESTKLKARCF